MENIKNIKNLSFLIWCLAAVIAGAGVAWIDSRPGWDDAGITAFLVFLIAVIFSFAAAQKPWLIALAVSIWIPVYSILSTRNYGALLALIPGFIGAFTGFLIRRSFRKNEKS